MKYMTPIIEVVTRITEQGKYLKNKQNEAQLKMLVEKLFKLHKSMRSEESAEMVYEGIIDLAKLGKGNLANKFAMRFEEEIGYKQ